MVFFTGSLFSLIIYWLLSIYWLSSLPLEFCLSQHYLSLTHSSSRHVMSISTHLSLLLCPRCRMKLNSGCYKCRLKPSEGTLARSKISCVITRREMQTLQGWGGRYRDRRREVRWGDGGRKFLVPDENRKEN